MTTPLRTSLAALILAVALVPAGTADAASKKSKRSANKTAVVKKKQRTAAKKPAKPVKAAPAPAAVAAETPAPAPAPVETPTFTSVISIGGFVFHNVSYADAVAQYQALIASGATPPPPATSISVAVTVGT